MLIVHKYTMELKAISGEFKPETHPLPQPFATQLAVLFSYSNITAIKRQSLVTSYFHFVHLCHIIIFVSYLYYIHMIMQLVKLVIKHYNYKMRL